MGRNKACFHKYCESILPAELHPRNVEELGRYIPLKPGKDDYYKYNPKAYRTITLEPVPLKWMERVILWNMEADLKINSKFSKKQ